MPDDLPDAPNPRDDPLRVSLKRLGLGHHEAAVYAALVERSPAGAAWLAKRCGIARSSVYTALGTLADKGLVGTAHAGEVKQFVAQGHAALMDLVQREQERATARVTLAEGLATHFRPVDAARVPDVVTFEGQDGLKQVYLSMLREARGTLLLLRDEFLFAPDWAFTREPAWRERVAAVKGGRDLRTRLLTNRSPTEEAHGDWYRTRPGVERRFLPAGMRVDRFALYVGGDVVAVLSMEQGHLVGVRIANAHLAANFAGILGALWDASAPDPAPTAR